MVTAADNCKQDGDGTGLLTVEAVGGSISMADALLVQRWILNYETFAFIFGPHS